MKRLGRNLNTLLSQNTLDVLTKNPVVEKNSLRLLPIEFLKPGRYQPRQTFNPDGLQELANSIKTQGIINPIIVRRNSESAYEIIAGERRWRAAQLALLSEVPVIIKEITDETALAIGLIENIQRQDLNPLEEAIGLERLVKEFGMTHQQLAQVVGKSRTTITNSLRLLNLHPQVKQLIIEEQLEMGHARTLITLSPEQQLTVANQIIQKKLSVRDTEKMIRTLQRKKNNIIPSIPVRKIDPNLSELQRNLSDKWGTSITFKHKRSGKGQLIIDYHHLDDLEKILQRIT